jgi:hypothetical protein
MAGDKRILIETLLEEPRVSADRVRAALLLNSSTSPAACARADLLDYALVDGRSGLVVGQPPRRLSAIVEHLSELDAVPPELLEREPSLTLADLRACARVVGQLLRACERGEPSDAGE